MSRSNALYTDLSGYYDLMCADVDYPAQSQAVHRLQQLFGNGGKRHLDLACGTGPHIRQLLDLGYQCQGLDLNEPMLEQGRQRCPEALFSQGDMCEFSLTEPVDLITCFLYSLHYCATLERLQRCIALIDQALAAQGLFCFNTVDKNHIDNQSVQQHSALQHGSHFLFQSSWYYPGQGSQQQLKLSILRRQADQSEVWQDSHTMVATSFDLLLHYLEPYFEVHLLEHDYQKIVPWNGQSGNALVVCVKKQR
ncbi:class I SAM-dependent methyltransferase [Rheinheimera sp.]|uniref:class I SAM-dependent DNA methyltransferase n=1 Tax=Rheinheimera sp. TaxID=1869214 RepID=UPI00307D7346